MGRTRLVFFLLVLAMLPDPSSAASTPPSPWLEIHSTHYTVITDAGEKKGHEVALRFEQMRAAFGSLLMKERLNEPQPVTILAFKSDKSYYQAAPLRGGQPLGVPGFVISDADQKFIALNLFEPEPWRAVAHDFAVMLLNDNYPPAQGWFDEGLAQYFSSIRLNDQKYEIGSDPELQSPFPDDLSANQAHSAGLTPPKSFTELLSGEVWLALPDLLTMKHKASIADEGTRHTLFYAQSWITMHYLIHEKQLPETGTYFDLVENQHMPVEQAIEKAYGMTAGQFDKAVKDYFHSLTPLFAALDATKTGVAQNRVPEIYQFPEPLANDTVITNKSIPQWDGDAIVAEVKARIPERRDAGLQELQKLAATPDPNLQKSFFIKPKKEKQDEGEAPLTTAIGNEIAHRALAWDHLQRNEFDAAIEELGDAAALNQKDMWVRYYLSVLKYRMSQSKKSDIQGLPNMLQDLRSVLEWYPEFADAYDLTAMARMEGGGPAAAMQAERAAIQLSPRNERYVYHMAEIYESDKKWDAARALLQHLESSGNLQIASEARERIGELSTNQKYGVAGAGQASRPLAPQSSPFDVLDQDAAKRAAEKKASQNETTADMRPEKFVKGRLVEIDCSQSPAAVLSVDSGKQVLKLRTSDYKSLLLIGADKFSCAWTDRAVSINYKPGGLADGDVVSVEVR